MFRKTYEEIKGLELDIFYFKERDIGIASELNDQLYDFVTKKASDLTMRLHQLRAQDPERPDLKDLEQHLGNFRDYATKCLKFKQTETKPSPEDSEDTSNIDVYESKIRDSADDGKIEDVEMFREQICDEASEQLAQAHNELRTLFLNQAHNPNRDRVDEINSRIENLSALMKMYNPDSEHYQRLVNQAEMNSWKQRQTERDE